MKRYLIVLILSLFFVDFASAQSSMTDDQVMQFAMKEKKAGSSQAQIVTKLMQKGVDISQIRRIRKKYEKQISSKGLDGVADNAVSSADATIRSNNGSTRKFSRKINPENTSAMEGYGYGDDFDDEELFMGYLEESLYHGRRVFGRDVFNKENLTFEPTMNIATPQNYVVGPGDKVKVDIYGASQKSDVYTVSPDGDITIDGYGLVNLSGLTVKQANARLRSTLGSRYSSSKIKLSLGQTRTVTVNVMGEVQMPGTYTLSAFSSVFHALYMAGGISSIGTLRNIKVFRNGKQISVVDVYDFIMNGKLSGNVRLQDNDVIMVGPYDCIVDIAGNVKRPMYYEMKKNESISTLLKYAGSFAGDAYTKAVRVIRRSGEKNSVFNVQEFDMSSFHVADGDSVFVDKMLQRYDNMVRVNGSVFRPGMYQLGGDITTVRSLIEHAEGVTEDAFTAHAVMHRLNADRTLKVISVDVGGILSGKVADIPLQNEDDLYIPSYAEQKYDKTIKISGEVRWPGTYLYAENKTLEDFVLQAGGLKVSASPVKVDVSRRITDNRSLEADTILAETFSFALKDGFVIDGQPGFVLRPYDQVYVHKSPGYVELQNVYISGEVNFPGTYALAKENTRLSDIVKAAGGFKTYAYVKGSRLERRITKDERERMQKVLRMVNAQNSGEDSIEISKLDLGEIYNVGIQLDKAIENPGSDYDVTLSAGDTIIVPKYTNTVKISGNVLYPNTVAYKEGMGAKYYVNQAGGFGERARKKATFIIHMNGTVNQMGKGEKPTPGCEIIVPTKPKADPTKVAQWLSIGTSVASMGAVMATIVSLIK